VGVADANSSIFPRWQTTENDGLANGLAHEIFPLRFDK
jgi:hypothetical protein